MGMERVLQARIILWAVEMLRRGASISMAQCRIDGHPAYTLPYSKMAGRNFSWMSQMLLGL